jgi:hypothetical protein
MDRALFYSCGEMPQPGDGEMPKINQQGTQQGEMLEDEKTVRTTGNLLEAIHAQKDFEAQEEEKRKASLPPVFEDWIAKQPEEIQKMYEAHTSGLKGALKTERESAKNHQKRLAEITKLLGSDPEKAKQEMDKLAEENKASQARIEFLEDAMKPEIECLNPAAAWLVAQGKGLFRSNGVPDWKSIREEAPELFGKRTVRTHGGDGTGEEAPKKWNINDAMREKMKEARGG